MFQFVGYSAFAGPDALSSAPSQVDNITKTRITNAIFDHVNITRDTDLTFNTNKPDGWTFDTILDANLNGNLQGGNVDFQITQISSFKIKRRKKGDFTWITIAEIEINGDPEKANFTVIDSLNIYGVDYEYALVPMMGDVEGEYIINSIVSDFNGVFICDIDTIFRFYYDVQYGTNARNQESAVFKPLGRQYPVVVSNGLQSYDSGTVSGTIINDSFDDTGVLNVTEITKKKKLIKDFLTNRKAKILKDWNSNAWLLMVTSSPQITYESNSGMRIPTVQFDWVEIGDVENELDLYNSGLVKEVN